MNSDRYTSCLERKKKNIFLDHHLSHQFVKFCYHVSLQVPNKDVQCNTRLQEVSTFISIAAEADIKQENLFLHLLALQI